MRCAYPAHSCTSSSSIHPIFGSICHRHHCCCVHQLLLHTAHCFMFLCKSDFDQHPKLKPNLTRPFVLRISDFAKAKHLTIMRYYAHSTTSDDPGTTNPNKPNENDDDVNHTHSAFIPLVSFIAWWW